MKHAVFALALIASVPAAAQDKIDGNLAKYLDPVVLVTQGTLACQSDELATKQAALGSAKLISGCYALDADTMYLDRDETSVSNHKVLAKGCARCVPAVTNWYVVNQPSVPVTAPQTAQGPLRPLRPR